MAYRTSADRPLAVIAGWIIVFAITLASRRSDARPAPENPGRTHYRLGLDASEKHNWAEAVRQLDWTLEYMPKSPKVHNALGLACLEDGKVDRAAVEFRRAIALKPDFAEAYYNMAVTLERRNDDAGAIQFFKWGIHAGLANAEADDAQGFLLLQQSDLGAAAHEFESALKENPSLAPACVHLGTAFWLEQKYAKAVSELQKALALDPLNAEAKHYLDLASARLGQTQGSPADKKYQK